MFYLVHCLIFEKQVSGFFGFCCCCIFFETGVSLCDFGAYPGTTSCTTGWPQSHREVPASASQLLDLKACVTTTKLRFLVY